MYYSITAIYVHTIKIHDTSIQMQNKSWQILALWPSGLANYIACKKFEVQILLLLVGFLIHHKSGPRHHRSIKLGSKWKHLKKRIHTKLPHLEIKSSCVNIFY